MDWLSIENLGTEEMCKRWDDHFSLPPLFNDLGCFRVQFGPMAIQDFMYPPFSGKNEGTGMLYINRKHPATEGITVGYTWYPDKVRRRSELDGIEIETITRAPVRTPGALVSLKLKNPSSESRKIEVGIKTAGRLIHTIEGWASIGPQIEHEKVPPEIWEYSSSLGAMCYSSFPKAFSAHGSRPFPDRVENKTFLYDIEIPPGGIWELQFAVGLGESENEASNCFLNLIENFDSQSEEVKQDWQEKVRAAFTPDNSIFSGHLPTLHTEEEELARLYYQTFLGCLVLRRDNPLSQIGPTYVTLSPNYWTTASFLWDKTTSTPFFVLLDPKVFKNLLNSWLNLDLQKAHAFEYVNMNEIGCWYSINDSAIVRMSYDYVRYTGDFAWLDTEIKGNTILDHLHSHALAWHGLDKNGHGLADCGGVDNLLECVSTYIHEVASKTPVGIIIPI